MSSSSIYRGPSSQKLGEAPGVPVEHGEQFLWAAPDLWEQAPAGMLDRIRPWMTLDARGQDYSALGGNIEGWSYFPFEHASRGMRFVVRLVGAGTYDRRAAYFAHGRAWPEGECRAENDPGTLMGRGDAFSEPCRENPEPFEERALEPETSEWRKTLEADAEKLAATNLLTYLYQACVTHNPVVMAVPVREFVAGSALHKLVAFARAGLPWEVKRDSRIRVYTGSPSTFLQNLRADLIAIPEDLASEAMRVNPELVLLDRGGRVHAGTGSAADRPVAPYKAYAETVVERFCDSPERLFVPALLPFTGRVVAGADIAVQSPPPGAAMASIGNLYDWIATAGEEEYATKLLRFLFRQANKNAKIVQPWETMFRESEWGRLPAAAIEEVIRSEPVTADAESLQKHVRMEAKRRGLKLELPEGAEPARVMQFLADGFVTPDLARRRLRESGAPAVFDLLRQENGETERLVELLGTGSLPAGWVEQLPQLGSAAEAVERLLGAARYAVEGSPWEVLLHRALERLLKEGSVGVRLAEQLARLVPPSSPDGRLLMAEIVYRGKPEAGLWQIEQILEAKDREVRRSVMERLDHQVFTCLRQVKIPPEWDDDVRDLWLEASEARLRQLAPNRLVKLLSRNGTIPHRVATVLDERLSGEAKALEDSLRLGQRSASTFGNPMWQTTSALIAHDQWMRWRYNSKVLAGEIRTCAKAWVLDRTGQEVAFEAWKQVLLDLKPLSAQDIRQLRTECGAKEFRWPTVPLFEKEQVKDLIELAGEDWATLALIASTTGGNYGAVRSWAGLDAPDGFLEALDANVPLPGSWTLDDVRLFLMHAPDGCDRESRAADAIGRHLKSGDARAVTLASEYDLWKNQTLRRRLVETLWNDVGDAMAHALEKMIGGIPPAPKVNCEPDDLRQRRKHYEKRLYPGIGKWLCPAVELGLSYQEAVNSLMEGTARALVWYDFALAVQNRPGEDPLGTLLAYFSRLPQHQWERVRRKGPETFRQVLQVRPTLLYTIRRRVPALEVAAFLQPCEDVGKVASELVRIGVESTNPEGYWRAFLESLEYCQTRGAYRQQGRLDTAIDLIVWTQRNYGRSLWMTDALMRIVKEQNRGRR